MMSIGCYNTSMEETTKKYYPLGEKTLFMLIFRKSIVCVLLLPALVIGVLALQYVPDAYLDVAMYVLYGYTAILFFILCCTFFAGWLGYVRYGISLDNVYMRVCKRFWNCKNSFNY